MAREAWPAFQVNEEQFTAWLARVGGATPIEHAADLYLACACAANETTALVAFERTYATDLASVLGRHRVKGDDADELLQELRHRLFVGDPPRIADYAGTGSLRAWTRAVLVRMIIDRARGESRDRRRRDALEHLAKAEGIVAPKASSALTPQIAAALEASVAELDDADRLLLRLHYVDKLTTARIASLQRVHGVTILRRLARASSAIARAVRRRLRAELGMTPSQLQSVLRDVENELAITLPRILAPPP